MRSLVDEAEATFERLRQEDNPHSVIKLRVGAYDFRNAEEIPVVPIHIIEARQQENRRHGVVDARATPLDFIKAIGLDLTDSHHPVHGDSALRTDECTRAYFGNPEAEAYQAYRMQILRFTDDEQWLKDRTFLEGQMSYDRERLRYVERKGEKPEVGPSEPLTGFKKAFFERQAKTHPAQQETKQ